MVCLLSISYEIDLKFAGIPSSKRGSLGKSREPNIQNEVVCPRYDDVVHKRYGEQGSRTDCRRKKMPKFSLLRQYICTKPVSDVS